MFFFSKNNRTKYNEERRYPSMPRIPGRLTSLIITLIHNCQRTLLCISRKDLRGSLTIEAAVILPLFLLTALTFVSVLDICRIQTKEQTLLCQEAKKLSLYAYGISEEVYIDLPVTKPCRLSVSLLPGYTIPIALRGRVHAWIGRTEGECEHDKMNKGEDLVYVTDHESVYHTNAECTHLCLSIYEIQGLEIRDMRNDYGGKYQSCEKCCETKESDGSYYISPSGTAYHNSKECSGLTRNVRLVRKSDISHLSLCSRCGGA